MNARRFLAACQRARRAGRDLDAVSYFAGVVGGVVFLAAMTGAVGPSLDAAPGQGPTAQHHAAR